MYQVLLVDDEENVLEILKEILPWQELGVGMVLTAQNGRCALDILEQKQIDLLITDIKMPDVDGISLIRQVKTMYPHIRCILLTAYGEFEYAKEAINLGVENYLLKPVAREELEQTVQKALDNHYGHRQNGESLIYENILQRWMGGNISEEELSERADILGLNLYLPYYCVVCLAKKTEDRVRDFRYQCIEILSKENEVYPFWDEKGWYVLVVGGKELDRDKLADRLEVLATQQGMQRKVGISIGEVVANVGSLHLSYKIACERVELSDPGTSEVILGHSIETLQGLEADWLVEELRFLFFSQDEKTRDAGYQHLIYKLYQMIDQSQTDKMLVRLLGMCMRVLVTEYPLRTDLKERVYGHKWEMQSGLGKEAFMMQASQMLRFIQSLFAECYAQFSPIVQLAGKYVRESVLEGEVGSIKEFCAKNGMNPAYLGHIFKKETGFFFNDYLNDCRINRSLVLLRNPNNKIKDIALKVGFMSVSYYVKCFRECKGVSPTKYRMGMEE